MFNRRKKSFNYNYNDFVIAIHKEIRNKNLERCDGLYNGPLKKTLLIYNLHDINKLLKRTTIDTRTLLSSKGFTLSIEDRVEKTVLLGTEISELADAVKKGLGEEAEGFEIADIIIRATNFLCLDETYHSYQKLDNVMSQRMNEVETVTVSASIPDARNKMTHKYGLIEDMMKCWNEIQISSEMVEICCEQKLGEQSLTPAFVTLWSKILDLTAYCSAYTTLYLPENLQYYVREKMFQNMKRPYKYGTSEETK